MPRRRVRQSFLSGTMSEFSGTKQVPKLCYERNILFVLGPSGVGKTRVARHIYGEDTVVLRKDDLLDGIALRILLHRWPKTLREPQKLIIESPCFLQIRPTVQQSFVSLISERLQNGKQTAILDAEDHSPLGHVLREIPYDKRMTILLRFPSGRGRYRFLAHECKKRKLSVFHARQLSRFEPWCYSKVLNELDRLQEEKERVQS